MRIEFLKKLKVVVVYILGGMIALITSLSMMIGFFDEQVPQKIEKYFYRVDAWSGQWSSNTEYMIITDVEGFLPWQSDPVVVMLSAGAKNGSLTGTIVSKPLCELAPLTWVIFISSEGPEWMTLGGSRIFTISQLKGMKKSFIGQIKGTIRKGEDGTEWIEFSSVNTGYEYLKLDGVRVVKNAALIDQDEDMLQEYCAKMMTNFYDRNIDF